MPLDSRGSTVHEPLSGTQRETAGETMNKRLSRDVVFVTLNFYLNTPAYIASAITARSVYPDYNTKAVFIRTVGGNIICE